MVPSKAKQPPLTARVASVPAPDASTAANDDSISTVSSDLRNPLWIIAIGMLWFFGIVASVIALS